ncbi:uncharacterized protein DFL_000705 [Arthrobotrys flagrans]|uniref:Pentatricopeptide repeat-containing protein-mitochondrial domain-containing protein n=1 Tax=Arthrobotrys flagrans TaxID=97331 RepID=A0A437AFJ3_ARTFL|nr:hypothetical protein DFL_000705 [Arthrobotrys flagrans]
MTMLRPAVNAVQVDCQSLLVTARAVTRRRTVHTARQLQQNQSNWAPPASNRSRPPNNNNNTNLSDLSESLAFLTSNRPPPASRSLRRNGNGYNNNNNRNNNSYIVNRNRQSSHLDTADNQSFIRFRPSDGSSSQLSQNPYILGPEDDHGDAVNGIIPPTTPKNPAYAKLLRKLLDLTNNSTPREVFTHAKIMASKGYAPTLETYSCLIQACAHPNIGCTMQETALSLFEELKEEGYTPNSTIYHNLLKIFAHSPDYISMERILKEMTGTYGILPDVEGQQHILRHYLTTGQLERAMEMFYERRATGEKIHYNTYMEIIKALGRVYEVDEAMRVMLEFQKEWGSIAGTGIQPIAWYELLNIAASNYHIDGVSYIWKKVIQSPPPNSRQALNPDDGLCLKVLNTAARHGNPDLALEVFRILTLRNVPFQEHHYAALSAAYARSGQLIPAFRALTLMRNQGIAHTATTANAIVEALTSSGKIENVDSAYATLKDFVASTNDKDVVEVAGFNAVLAACVKLKDLERALGVYAECAALNVAPNTETFNTLFKGCVECSTPIENPDATPTAPNKELAMFLANEMKEMGLQPDFVTYEELLKVSLYQEEDYEDAFVYLEEMKEVIPGGKVRPMVYTWIAQRLEEKGDERLGMVVEEMKALGYEEEARVWESAVAKVAPPELVYKG